MCNFNNLIISAEYLLIIQSCPVSSVDIVFTQQQPVDDCIRDTRQYPHLKTSHFLETTVWSSCVLALHYLKSQKENTLQNLLRWWSQSALPTSWTKVAIQLWGGLGNSETCGASWLIATAQTHGPVTPVVGWWQQSSLWWAWTKGQPWDCIPRETNKQFLVTSTWKEFPKGKCSSTK